MRDDHEQSPRDENGTERDLSDQDKGHLAMVRQARELRLAFEQQLDEMIEQALIEADGDPDRMMELLADIDPASEQAVALVEAFLELKVIERLRRIQRNEGHEPLDPDGTQWRKRPVEED